MFPAGIVAVTTCLVFSSLVFSAAANADTVKVGVIAPLSGARADAGMYVKNAAVLAAEEINRSGVKFKVSLILEDSRYDPKTAVAAYTKLAGLDKARFIIGPYGSGEVLAVAPLSEKEGVLLMAPGAQAAEVSDAGQLIFRLIHNAAEEAPFFAPRVAEKMKDNVLHFLTATVAFTPPYLKLFRTAFEPTGKTIGVIEEFDVKDSDFRPELIRLKAAGAKEIFIIATPLNSGTILRQAAELGLRANWYQIGLESPEITQIAGAAAEGLLYPYSYDADAEAENVTRFKREYTGRYGTEPDTVAANSYDALKLLSLCFEQAGSATEKVAACLYAIRGYDGAGGRFSFDARGDAQKNLMLKTVRGGRFVRLD